MRKPHRVPDERIAEEIAALDAYVEIHHDVTAVDRRLLMFASGARLALEWMRDSRQADPMNPIRMLRLLDWAVPKVLEFERQERREGPS